jgi:hypothetical protein
MPWWELLMIVSFFSLDLIDEPDDITDVAIE